MDEIECVKCLRLCKQSESMVLNQELWRREMANEGLEWPSATLLSPVSAGVAILHPRPRQGLHLDRVLVVIAIIAILAALLLPALANAKQKALTASCLNDLKQLQLCYQMYVKDNNNDLPPNQVTSGTASTATSWCGASAAQFDTTTTNIQTGLLYQYNTSVKIYRCPADTKMISPGPHIRRDRRSPSHAIARSARFWWRRHQKLPADPQV